MSIVVDSYMSIIFPEDISNRIAYFIAGRHNFPFIRHNELICIFYLYGKDNKVNGEKELKEVIYLADRTVANMATDIEIYNIISNIFFFQAEDGIRDLYVTGVQTCALPIFHRGRPRQGPQRPHQTHRAGRGDRLRRPSGDPRPTHRSGRRHGLITELSGGSESDRKSVV